MAAGSKGLALVQSVPYRVVGVLQVAPGFIREGFQDLGKPQSVVPGGSPRCGRPRLVDVELARVGLAGIQGGNLAGVVKRTGLEMNAGTVPVEVLRTFVGGEKRRDVRQKQGQPSPQPTAQAAGDSAVQGADVLVACMCLFGILLGASTSHAHKHDCADDQGAQEQIPGEHHAGQKQCGDQAGKEPVKRTLTHRITPV